MRPRLLALALVLPLMVSGCATKKDLRQLRDEMETMRSSQVTLLREIQRQNQMLLDSLSSKDIRLRGDISNRLLQMERQLVQIQELTGQGQQRLSELRQQLRSQEEAIRAAAAASAAQPGNAAVGNPDEVFAAAQGALQRGSFTTARAGFEEFVRVFPQNPRVSEAQLAVGETFEKANDLPRALEAYGRVVELYPDAPHAATALYRSALIEAKRNNRSRARTMLNQVISAYPRSPEAPLARTELGRLR